MKKSTLKIWTIVSSVFLASAIISQFIFFVFIYLLKLLPIKLIIVIAAAMIFITAVISILAFFKVKEKSKSYIRQIISCILCLPVIAGCMIGSLAVRKLDKTVDHITTPPEISTVMSVYVLKENAASKIEDAKDFTFAVNESYSKSDNDKIIKQLEQQFNKAPKIKYYETMLKSVDALYKKEADALIISESNVVILEDMSGYESFEDITKVIYSMDILVEVPDDKPQKKPQSHSIKDLFQDIVEAIKPDNDNAKPSENSEKEELDNSQVNKPSSPNKEPFDPNKNPEAEENIGKADDPFIIYISGSDSRRGIMNRTLSDVNILAVANPKTKQILLVNTPRDIFLPNPAFGGQKDKLTHCGLAGINNSISALSSFYNVPVKYYVQFNFSGFETLIDLLGGVTVYSPKTFKTTHGQYPIHVGNNHLNGKVALSFVRERMAFLGGDDTRGWNQMQVIKNLIHQVSADELILNYSEILDTVDGMFITSMSRKKISQLADAQIEDMGSWEIYSFAITGTLGTDKPAALGGDEATVVYPHSYTVNKAKSLMKKVLNDTVIKKVDLY